MKILDPERPRNANGMPMLVSNGKPTTILPTVMVYPLLGEPGWNFIINACYNQTTARHYQTRVPDLESLTALFSSWEKDPEALLSSLGWNWTDFVPTEAKGRSPSKEKPSGGVKLSLADLGLDL